MAARLGNGGVTNQLILAGANIEAKNKVNKMLLCISTYFQEIFHLIILVYVVKLTFQSTLCLLVRPHCSVHCISGMPR